MNEQIRILLQGARERSCRLPYEESDLAERVYIARELFDFVGLPEEDLDQAFANAERVVGNQRALNLGDVISAWLQTLPESEIDDSRLIG